MSPKIFAPITATTLLFAALLLARCASPQSVSDPAPSNVVEIDERPKPNAAPMTYTQRNAADMNPNVEAPVRQNDHTLIHQPGGIFGQTEPASTNAAPAAPPAPTHP